MTSILAIETSQRQGSVALGVDDAAPVLVRLDDERADRSLLPAIDQLVRDRGLSPDDLDVVAVSIGPGGFSGLRVSIAIAKGLAEVLDVKVIGVPSALIAVEGIAHEGPLHVALACKRGTWWGTCIERRDGRWAIAGEPGLFDAETLHRVEVAAIVADEYLPAVARSPGLPVLPLELDAGRCLAVGRRMHEHGEHTAADHLLPIYPRPPEAVRKWAERSK